MKNKQHAEAVAKKQHPVAERLAAAIRKKLTDRRVELRLTEDALGEKTFNPLGYRDKQKKLHNLLNGKTEMKITDFYIICEGLELIPDRVFASAVDDALNARDFTTQQTDTAEKKRGRKKLEKSMSIQKKYQEQAYGEYT